MNVDFARAVLNLRMAGLSCPKQAQRIGMKDKGQKLYRIVNGVVKTLEFHEGLKLLDLHLDVCGPEKHKTLVGESQVAA